MMSSNRVWAPSNTGTKYHAFMGSIGAKDGNFRAACRVSTQRKKTAHYISRDQIAPWDSVCAPCERAFRAAEDRADHSMRPATEADDLGYVAPVDERTETPQPEQCTCECTWKCDRPADEPCTCPCVCGAAPAEAAPVPEQQQPALTVGGLTFYAKQTEATTVAAPLVDLSTEDGTLKLANGDELTRRGHWADVWLKDGRTYSVSMKVHRKGSEGASTILVDHVIYWTETAGRSTGPIRVACPDDKPRSVGGRIWRLLLAANIA